MAKHYIALGVVPYDNYWNASYPCKSKKEAETELRTGGSGEGYNPDSLKFIEIDLDDVDSKVNIEKAPVVKICSTVKKDKKKK